MTSCQVTDKNYIQLGQIADILNDFHDDKVAIISKIKAIIDNNFNVNYKLPNSFVCPNKPHLSGYTALHFAADFTLFPNACFSLLIQHGADFTIQNDKGYSPLLLVLKNTFDFKDDPLLFSHLTKNNMKKSCKYGISLFHLACSVNKLDVVDLFLKAGVSVDERVSDDSPSFPGYTPLHFAARLSRLQTIELLLNNGANMRINDAKGISPLHLLIENLNIYYNLTLSNYLSKLLCLIYLPDHVGLTKSHVSCMTDNISLINSFINQDEDIDSPINFDSSLWPGYTPLHVAANFHFKTVILLLEKGANLLAKDASGTTPFDLCIKKYNLGQIIQILLTEKPHQLSQIKLTDGTKLLDVLRAMKSDDEFLQFMKDKIMNVNIFIPLNSLIWPGWNLLHLTVMLNRYQYSSVNSLLTCSVDFTMLNADGRSPLHLAFFIGNDNAISNILNFHARIPINPVDRDNLSHFHIACAMQDYNATEILLKNGADPNLPTLNDPSYNYHPIAESSTPFHLATDWIDVDLFEKFLSSGANINASNVYGITPLHSIFLNNYHERYDFSDEDDFYPNCLLEFIDLEILIEQWFKSETDVTSRNRMTALILNIAIRHNCRDTEKLIKKFIEAKRYEDLGLTRLHIACALGDLPMVREELESGADVNQQVTHVLSSYEIYCDIFCQDTALHIHSRKRSENMEITEILLAHGANPNLKNERNLTPVHSSKNEKLQEMLLSNKNFHIENPVDDDGLSHFHLCCKLKNLDLVEEYLKSGVNVNTTVNYFADFYAGYSPLHFAIEYSSLEIFKLLLKYGADLNIEAANGLTPLLMAMKVDKVSMDQMKSLLSFPLIDIQIMKLFKETILEKIFENYNYTYFFRGSLIDEKIELFFQSGCELNKKDNTGKTILHKADNYQVIDILLLLGADINIKNDEGQTPYVHKTNSSFPHIQEVFIRHIKKLKLAGLFVDQSNEMDCNEDTYEIEQIEKEKCQLDVNLKEIINLSFDVSYFYSEEFVVGYWRMPVHQRQAICNFCESNNLKNLFPTTYGLIKLQFRKARARTRLLEPAAVALQSLVDLAIPELCLELIFDYLKNNDDLMNLVRAEYGSLIFAPLPENSIPFCNLTI